MNAFRRMRTLAALAEHYREIDEHTAITAHFLRQKVLAGEIPCVRAGNKRLIAIEDVDAFLSGEITRPQPELLRGQIRKIG